MQFKLRNGIQLKNGKKEGNRFKVNECEGGDDDDDEDGNNSNW